MSRTIVPDDVKVVKGETRAWRAGSASSIGRGGGRATEYDLGLRQAHAEIASLSPAATAELILALTLDTAALAPADLAKVRLAAIRLAREIAAVAA